MSRVSEVLTAADRLHPSDDPLLSERLVLAHLLDAGQTTEAAVQSVLDLHHVTVWRRISTLFNAGALDRYPIRTRDGQGVSEETFVYCLADDVAGAAESPPPIETDSLAEQIVAYLAVGHYCRSQSHATSERLAAVFDVTPQKVGAVLSDLADDGVVERLDVSHARWRLAAHPQSVAPFFAADVEKGGEQA